jgi:hypothetical protein
LRAPPRRFSCSLSTQEAAAAWLSELKERDDRGRFLATAMFFMISGTKGDRCPATD